MKSKIFEGLAVAILCTAIVWAISFVMEMEKVSAEVSNLKMDVSDIKHDVREIKFFLMGTKNDNN